MGAPMNDGFLIVDVKDRVATVTFNNPPANLLSTHVLKELDRHVERFEADPTVKVVVFTALGRFFCPGADVKELRQIKTAQQGKDLSSRGQDLLNRIERLDKPVIAAVNGPCLGGGLELALACHMRIAAQEASFGLPELHLGLIPGYGGTQRLVRTIGPSKATELILTGATISADDALTLGLVNEVCPQSDLLPRAHALADLIKSKGAPAIRAALQALRAGQDLPLAEGLAREAELFGQLFETHDAKEGTSAFLEKRPPNFQDQ